MHLSLAATGESATRVIITVAQQTRFKVSVTSRYNFELIPTLVIVESTEEKERKEEGKTGEGRERHRSSCVRTILFYHVITHQHQVTNLNSCPSCDSKFLCLYLTERLHRMQHRKWRETKKQPGTAEPDNMLG